MSISAHLIKWYQHHHRPLPWRETTDPYKIWLSEVILQQTRVDQGMPYYQRFVEFFPTITHLADASEDRVMKLWQGLGYYSRARNLHATAKIVRDKYNGIFPSDYLNIRNLPGIGDYTAAAVASFAFNEPHAVVDGNVIRVLSRVFGITDPVDQPAGKKIIIQLAIELLDKKFPALHNQAIMEFGAMLCKPVQPDCKNCFLQKNCKAFSLSLVEELPFKLKKTKTRDRYFNYLLIRNKEFIYLKKRGPGDIWQNLFDFPLIETEQLLPAHQITETGEWSKIIGKQPVHINSVTEKKVHKLSHQNIFTRIFDISLLHPPDKNLKSAFLSVNSKDVVNYAVPKIIENILEEQLASYSSE